MTQTQALPYLDPRKFQDPDVTADGEERASVALTRLETLWFNTGTLCNLECTNCYIESSPRNDRLVYLTAAEVAAYLDEIERDRLGTREIGFTGGEPFMNPEMLDMLKDVLERGFESLVLTNAMRPMMKCADGLLRAARGVRRPADDSRLHRPLRAGAARGGARRALLGTDDRGLALAFRLRLPLNSRWPHALGRRRKRIARWLRPPLRRPRRAH